MVNPPHAAPCCLATRVVKDAWKTHGDLENAWRMQRCNLHGCREAPGGTPLSRARHDATDSFSLAHPTYHPEGNSPLEGEGKGETYCRKEREREIEREKAHPAPTLLLRMAWWVVPRSYLSRPTGQHQLPVVNRAQVRIFKVERRMEVAAMYDEL